MLLVLDNADGIAGHATVVEELVNACARVTILATSREPLRVAGEVLYRLAGLPIDLACADILNRQPISCSLSKLKLRALIGHS